LAETEEETQEIPGTGAADPPDDVATDARTTLYHILESQDDGKVWTRLGKIEATNNRHALSRYYHQEEPDEDKLYLAVADRSFRPQRVAPRSGVSISEVELD
jgi:hypothetical protein